jgi:hypothetical protein
MTKKFRLQLIAGIGLLVVITVAVYAYQTIKLGNLTEALVLLFGAVVILIANGVFYHRRASVLAQGEPFEDERDMQVKNRAGALAFYWSLYWLLALMFYSIIGSQKYGWPELESDALLGYGILGMAVIFGFCYIYVNKLKKN